MWRLDLSCSDLAIPLLGTLSSSIKVIDGLDTLRYLAVNFVEEAKGGTSHGGTLDPTWVDEVPRYLGT